jgi:antitoxin component YwqK of YwqJK toxin-antitoxin module
VAQAFEILKKTAQKNIFAKTIYSTVADLNTGDIHISVNANFSQITIINLYDELKKGKHSYHLSELIKHPIVDRKNIEVHDDEFLSKNVGKIFLDKYWKPTTNSNKTKFYRLIDKDEATQSFIVKDYFKNGIRQGIACYASLDPEIIDGKYFEFDESGNIKVEGQFKNRLKDGVWTYWSIKGEKEKTVTFADGVKQ